MDDSTHSDESKLESLPELSLAGIPSFLKSDVVAPKMIPDGTDAAVVGVPFDGGQGKRPGARFGPRGLREATGTYAYYTDYKGKIVNIETNRCVDYSDLSIVDCGDAPTVPSDIHRTRKQVRTYVDTVTKRAFPVILGGDHYLTFPAFEGVAGSLDEPVGVIQIDAHSDTVGESTLHGEHFNGSPMARIAQSEYGSYESHALVGLRGHEDEHYFEHVDQQGTFVATMNDIRETNIDDTLDAAIDHVTSQVNAVYVTIDIDVVDPAFAPGTGSPQPGGLTSSELVNIADELGKIPEVVAFDFMEVAPPYDPTDATVILGAKAITRFLEQRFMQ